MAGLDDGAQKGTSKLSKKVDFVELDAKDAPVKDIKWGAQQIETQSDPIQDPGVGPGVIVRNFFFKSPPRKVGVARPSKQQIIEGHKHVMATMLWADGLEPVEDKAVRLYSRKELKKGSLRQQLDLNKADFVIMVVATPKQGVVLADKPNVLT